MSTDFNDELNTQLTSETKLTLASGKVANFAYDSDAYASDTVAGVADYDYDNHQNIPLGDATTLNTDSSILNKGVRSQASSLTRMMLNHFFGRTSFNVNKLSDHVKNLLTTMKNFIKEGSNEWSPTVVYEAGDVVYCMSELNHEPCKRTFKCVTDCPTANLPPVYTDGSLINTTYWKELSGRVISLTVGNANSGQTNVATFNGSITVSGNITQSGTPYETHAEQIYTKKDNIITREDATGALPSNSYSGLKIFNYDGNGTNGILAYRSDGTAVVGDEAGTPAVETLQPLLTRAEEGSAQLVNGGILVWNNVTKRAETTTLAGIVTLNLTTNTTIENYNTDVMVKVTAPNVTITMGVVAEFAEVTFFAQYDTVISFNGITDTLPAYENCKLQYIAGTWYVTSNESAGDVKGNATDTKPFGTLLCDGSVLTGTDETSYPRLWHALTIDDGQGGTTGKYNLPSDPATVRRLPDFRETVLVGAGESTRADIASHDVYSVGQFKDDQMQGHRHKSYNASGTTGSPYNVALLGKDGQNGQDIFAYEIVTDGTNGTPRVGTTTHGKQIGINYIIKY